MNLIYLGKHIIIRCVLEVQKQFLLCVRRHRLVDIIVECIRPLKYFKVVIFGRRYIKMCTPLLKNVSNVKSKEEYREGMNYLSIPF